MTQPQPRRGDLLVIEDDPDARANLRDILEMDGYRVAQAGTAAEVLNRTDLDEFLAVILDRRLPDASADFLLPRLKLLAPQAAVIVLTGYDDLQGAVDALREGATDYILKPFNADALRAGLERIAERRRLTLAKERSEAAFRQLVEAAECLIVIFRPDNALLYLNPFAERLGGYSTGEVRGRDGSELLPLDTARDPDLGSRRESAPPRPIRGFEHRFQCRDGSYRWIVWNTRDLDDYEEGPAVLAVGQDVTSLKEAQERALQSERLAAIGQMMAGLTHESRNALQRSQACLEMLALRVSDRPEALDLIGRIQRAQDHLHHLYEDVRGYASPIRLDRRACELSEIWREAWVQLDALRRGRSTELVESPNLIDTRLVADRFRLGQVFRNILENSLAACSGDARVTIDCESAELDGQPALTVRIRDDGPGFGPEQLPRVFEPFYTTKTKGTGLGMAIARRITEAHGGRIEVSDVATGGAEVIITLPRGEP